MFEPSGWLAGRGTSHIPLTCTPSPLPASSLQELTLETGRGRYSKYASLAFTEHGVAMLSSVLSSPRAVQMNIIIIRAFVKLRELLATHKDLARKIGELEDNQKQHARTQQEHTAVLIGVVRDIQKLKAPPITRAIGFVVQGQKKKQSTL